MEKGYLTIGQLAKLLNISHYQIRYFEEKGIIQPTFIAENGYRMYGIDEIYVLSHVLFLRELDISVKDCGTLLANNRRSDYIHILEDKTQDIDAQIMHLTSLKRKINHVIAYSKRQEQTPVMKIEERREAINLQEVIAYTKDYRFTALDYYNLSVGQGIAIDETLYELHTEQGYKVCIPTKDESPLRLRHGKYLTFETQVDTDEDAEAKVNAFLEYAKREEIQVTGDLIIQHDSKVSLFENAKVFIKILMHIKED